MADAPTQTPSAAAVEMEEDLDNNKPLPEEKEDDRFKLPPTNKQMELGRDFLKTVKANAFSGATFIDMQAKLDSADHGLSLAKIEMDRAAELFKVRTDPAKFPYPGTVQHEWMVAASQQENVGDLKFAERELREAAQAALRVALDAVEVLNIALPPLLPPDLLDEANRRAAFFKEDAATMTPQELLALVNTAVFTGDKTAQYLCLRYIQKQDSESHHSGDPESYTGNVQDTLSGDDREAWTSIRKLLSHIAESFADRRAEPFKKRALALRDKAVDAIGMAGARENADATARAFAEVRSTNGSKPDSTAASNGLGHVDYSPA